MATSTYLQAVKEEEIKKLRAKPELIMKLDSKLSFFTQFQCSLNYFLTGDAYPLGKKPLEQALNGVETIDCRALEYGNFDLVVPEKVAAIEAALKKIDLKKIQKKIEGADFESLMEDDDLELFDLELLIDDDKKEAVKTLISDLKELITFYNKVAKAGSGIVFYTT